MEKLFRSRGFDELDRLILDQLQRDGRVSVADLARSIHLSQPAVHNRIKRLEKHGVIARYTAVLAREVIGFGVLGLISIQMAQRTAQYAMQIQQALCAMSEVLECYRITGQYDFLLKVVAEDQHALDQFIMREIETLPGIALISTNVVLSSVKESSILNLY
jgi:Lrp/AsnC family transcriptional regulator, leucine-responsive regulatory protein